MQNLPYRVVNIVASIFLNQILDLKDIHKHIERTNYNPRKYHSVVYRPIEVKSTILIAKSGTIIFSGANCLQDIQMAKNLVIDKLNKIGLNLSGDYPLKVVNMVGVADLGMQIDLIKVVSSMGLESVEYEPESFPSVIYRFSNSNVSLLIFRTGKLVMSGAKSQSELQNKFNDTYKILNLTY